MESIQGLRHSKGSFLLSLARIFERMGYYGLRAVFVLYIISELKFSDSQALTLYDSKDIFLVIGLILGGFLGDASGRNAFVLIAGVVLQVVGAVVLALFPFADAVYIGAICFILGSGIYAPNFLKIYTGQYLERKKLMVAGFALLYLAINIGAFIGSYFVGYIAEYLSYKVAFLVCAAAFTFGGIFLFWASPGSLFRRDWNISRIRFQAGSNAPVWILVIFLSAIFWGVYEIFGEHLYEFNQVIADGIGISSSAVQSITLSFSLPVFLGAFGIWTFFYSNNLRKFSYAFFLFALSLALFFAMEKTATTGSLFSFGTGFLLLSFAELLVVPAGMALIGSQAPWQWMALMFSIYTALSLIIVRIVGSFSIHMDRSNFIYFIIGFILIFLALFWWSNRVRLEDDSQESEASPRFNSAEILDSDM